MALRYRLILVDRADVYIAHPLHTGTNFAQAALRFRDALYFYPHAGGFAQRQLVFVEQFMTSPSYSAATLCRAGSRSFHLADQAFLERGCVFCFAATAVTSRSVCSRRATRPADSALFLRGLLF